VLAQPSLFALTLLQAIKAKAIYDYAATSPDELDLTEGATYDIIDHSDASWWKAERAGRLLMVPAAYLEAADR
jgi:hypothetical protein